MAVAVKLISGKTIAGQTRVQVGFTLTGNYPTGGDTVDLTPLIGQGHNSFVFCPNNPPIYTDTSLNSPYTANFIPGSTLKNGLLRIISMVTQVEFAAGVYSASLLADANIASDLVFDELL